MSPPMPPLVRGGPLLCWRSLNGFIGSESVSFFSAGVGHPNASSGLPPAQKRPTVMADGASQLIAAAPGVPRRKLVQRCSPHPEAAGRSSARRGCSGETTAETRPSLALLIQFGYCLTSDGKQTKKEPKTSNNA